MSNSKNPLQTTQTKDNIQENKRGSKNEESKNFVKLTRQKINSNENIADVKAGLQKNVKENKKKPSKSSEATKNKENIETKLINPKCQKKKTQTKQQKSDLKESTSIDTGAINSDDDQKRNELTNCTEMLARCRITHSNEKNLNKLESKNVKELNKANFTKCEEIASISASSPLIGQKKGKRTKKSAKAILNDSYHKITEYFPQRRSERKPKTCILAEKQQELINKIKTGCEDGLKVVEFKDKGRGVITDRYFLKGDFVVEYIGDLIDLATAKKREAEYAKNKNVGCYMYYFHFKDKQYCLDGTAESGKLGRLVNHSRKGNLISKIVDVNSEPHLILFAKVDIEPGTEILYDYGDRDKESLRNHPWLAK